MISDQGSPGGIDRDLDPLNSTLFNQNQDKKNGSLLPLFSYSYCYAHSTVKCSSCQIWVKGEEKEDVLVEKSIIGK